MPRIPLRMAHEPPPGYVAFVERHLARLRHDAAQAAWDEQEADELYPDVLTDVAARWRWLEWQRTRFGKTDAAETYLYQSFLRRSGRWHADEEPPTDIEVWRSDGPPRPMRTSAAVRLAPQMRLGSSFVSSPIAEASIAWWHAYEDRRRRRLVAVLVAALAFVLVIARYEGTVGGLEFVLLTGAFGNVGSHTLAELLRRGTRVRCFDRDTREHWSRARKLPIECHWGDIRDASAVSAAVAGADTVLHLAALIPPASDEQPELAEAVNVDGTRNVVAACRARPDPPRLLYTSTFDVHGYTVDRPPPRHVDDPVVATNGYTAHKIAGEDMVRGSGLAWCIVRLVDVPVLGVREPHPIMFEIGLHNRIEVIHGADAALALVNALGTPEVWGRVLFVGGGPSCQLTYRVYLTRMLAAMGLRPLPEEAFATTDYVTDWVDSAESQRLLAYQRYGVDDITAAIAASLGWRRHLVPLARPIARAAMLRMSPYYSART